MQQARTTHVLADRYELGPVLGQGGMARVHQGVDRQLDRRVAIKVLAPPFDRDDEFVERFRREARAAAGLSHPNIVAVFDSGSDDGTHFIVTELVEGETLADRLRDGPMPPADAVAVAVDIARALAAAHALGLIHRDIKPGNVMLLPDGRVKVVDFGIARAAGSDTLTHTGVVLGSTAYLSPEQAGGQPVDERADLYSLGCVLYEMLTGRVPFRADTPIATMYRHVNEDAPPPSTIAPVQPELEDVVLRCLEKDPKRRFASAAELEAALLAVPLARGGDTMRLETVRRRRDPAGRARAPPDPPVGPRVAVGATRRGPSRWPRRRRRWRRCGVRGVRPRHTPALVRNASGPPAVADRRARRCPARRDLGLIAPPATPASEGRGARRRAARPPRTRSRPTRP
jgi:serine/threonine-protein kinase